MTSAVRSLSARRFLRNTLVWVFLGILLAGISAIHFADASPGNNTKQKKKELEDKKKKLQQEIEYKKKLLEEVKGNKSKSMLMLAIINNKMKDQEELILTLHAEINELGSQIDAKKGEIKKAEDELTKLKN